MNEINIKLTGKSTRKCLCISKCVNIFDIIRCKEEQASQIIAWLLNPREAHGFKKDFFKAMLDAMGSEKILGYKGRNTNGDSLISKQTLLKSYNDVIIQTEYCINKSCRNKKEGRVDILLCLEDVKTIFVIENKYGSKEHGEQAKNYFKYFSSAAYKNYTIFYIYLDFNAYYDDDSFPFSDIDHKKYWHFIDYDWIIDFLKKKKDKKNVPDFVRKIIHDIIVEFDGYENDEYFSPFYDKKTELIQQFKNDIDIYKKLKSKPYPYSPINKNKPDKQFVLYNDFYNQLSQYSSWDNVFAILNEDNDYMISGKGNKHRDIMLRKIKNKKLKECWPFYINLRIYEIEDEENETKQQNLEIKLICTNEYIKTQNKTNIQGRLKNLFENREEEYQTYVKNNIENIHCHKQDEHISFFYLRKDTIEDFDFGKTKNKELNKIINGENGYIHDLKEMYKIFFPSQKGKK